MSLSIADAIAFGVWAQQLGRAPTIEEIAERFPGRDRATVYRWRRHLLAAWGLPTGRSGQLLRTAMAPQAQAA